MLSSEFRLTCKFGIIIVLSFLVRIQSKSVNNVGGRS
jgi:hypothetical protein